MTSIIKLIAQYAYFIVLCLEVLLAVCLITFKVVKHFKGKKVEVTESKELAEELKLSNQAVDDEKAINLLITSIIPASIELAEHSGIIGGKLKKVIAMSDCMLKCSEAHIDWQKVSDFVSGKIEDLINFSKQVNNKKGQ